MAATERYSFQNIITSDRGKQVIDTFPSINPEDLQSDSDFFVSLGYGQRIDTLAAQYLGDGRYWWIICLVNGLKTPFDSDLTVGQILRIPTSINKVIQVLESTQNGG